MASSNDASCDCLCIVMARGGSKRVPHKNKRMFNGRPMLAWPIEIALESELFSDVVISTDDNHIAELAVQYGAQLPFLRPIELASDFTTTAEVLRYTLSTLKEKHSKRYKYCCCLYGTSAMIRKEYLQNAFDKLASTDTECVYAVAEYSHPIERALQFNQDNSISYRFSEHVSMRTQDIQPSYYDLGLFYLFSVEAFQKTSSNSFLALQKTAIILPRFAAIDIDNEEDLFLAENIMQTTNHYKKR